MVTSQATYIKYWIPGFLLHNIRDSTSIKDSQVPSSYHKMLSERCHWLADDGAASESKAILELFCYKH